MIFISYYIKIKYLLTNLRKLTTQVDLCIVSQKGYSNDNDQRLSYLSIYYSSAFFVRIITANDYSSKQFINIAIW